jgi:hypothetical protein
MLYIKALSNVEDAPVARKRWGIEAVEYTSQRFFPGNYKELQGILQEISEYQVPLPTPSLEIEYDWEDVKNVAVLSIHVRRENGEWVRSIFSNAVVFIMNSSGDTIDTIRV